MHTTITITRLNSRLFYRSQPMNSGDFLQSNLKLSENVLCEQTALGELDERTLTPTS